MLTLKYGLYHPDLENSFVETLSTLKKKDPWTPLLVIAPSSWILTHLKELLTLEHNISLLNVTFLNFHQLNRRIIEESDSTDQITIEGKEFYEYLLKFLLEKQFSTSPALGKLLHMPGLTSSLYQCLLDIKDAGIDPKQAIEAIDERFVSREDVVKLKEVFKLYYFYEELLKKLKIRDRSDLIRLAGELTLKSAFLKRFKHILAYGFYDLTGLQTDWFQSIFQKYPTTYFMPYIKDHTSFHFAEDFFKSVVLGQSQKSENLSSHRLPITGHRSLYLETISASGIRDEIWAVAKEILRLTEEKGYGFDEIGVVVRSMDTYLEVIDHVFSQHRIPYVSSGGEVISKYPLVKTIQQFCSLIPQNFYRNLVIDCLASPYFNVAAGLAPARLELATTRVAATHSAGNTNAGSADPVLWDLLSRKLGITQGLSEWLAKLKPTEKEGFSFSPKEEQERGLTISGEQVSILVNILTELKSDTEKLPKQNSWKNYVTIFQKLLEKYITIPETDIEDQALFQQVLEVLHSCTQFDQVNDKITQTEFLETFLTHLSRAKRELGQRNIRGVKVLDVMAARGVAFRGSFLLGLNEKIFPRYIKEEPFIRDSARRKISATLGNRLSEKLKGFEEEKLLFYLMIKSARERLYCLYQRSDEKGRVQVPSIYLRDLPELSGQKKITHRAIPRGLAKKLNDVPTRALTPKEAAIDLQLNKGDTLSCLEALDADTDVFHHLDQVLATIEQTRPNLTEFDGLTGNLSIWWQKKSARGFSPTSLETFAQCPFRFLMTKVMGIESLEEPEEVTEIEASDLGKVYHKILEKFYQSLKGKDYFNKGTPNIKPLLILEKIAREVLADYEKNNPTGYPLVWLVQKNEILENLNEFVSEDLKQIQSTRFLPWDFEVDASAELGDLAPPELKSLRFFGLADRIDIKQDAKVLKFRVIDYKSGKRKVTGNMATAAVRGEKLQLPIYLLLARNHIMNKVKTRDQILADKSSFAYITQGLEKGRPVTRDLPGDFWKTDGRKLCGTLEIFMDYIKEGVFFITPKLGKGQVCEWCKLFTLCRKAHTPTRYRTEHSKEAQKYYKIREIQSKKKAKPQKKN